MVLITPTKVVKNRFRCFTDTENHDLSCTDRILGASVIEQRKINIFQLKLSTYRPIGKCYWNRRSHHWFRWVVVGQAVQCLSAGWNVLKNGICKHGHLLKTAPNNKFTMRGSQYLLCLRSAKRIVDFRLVDATALYTRQTFNRTVNFIFLTVKFNYKIVPWNSSYNYTVSSWSFK